MRDFKFLVLMLLAVIMLAPTGCKEKEPEKPNEINTPEPKIVTISFKAGEYGEFAEGVQTEFTDTVGAAFVLPEGLEVKANEDYEFLGWNKEVPSTFQEDMTIRAMYKQIKENGYELVDLGLSVMWASCNVGAKSPEEAGKYFAWGDTVGYAIDEEHEFSWANYFDATFSIYKKGGDLKELKAEHDAATKNWGGKWRMPTKEEFDELIDKNNCIWTWNDEKNGYEVKSKKNNNSIFLPAAGYRNNGALDGEDSGIYWSHSFYEKLSYNAWYLFFHFEGAYTNNYDRINGHPVRAVCEIGK